MDSGLYLNYFFSLLLKKIIVPVGYHNQVKAVKELLSDDVTGLVDSLTDFAVDSGSVEFTIETDNQEFNKILKKWLDTINVDYKGKIPIGIESLAKEYFKERWKGSSFPILKISKWDTIDGVLLPTKMFFVDGESIRAKDKDENEENLTIDSYNYYLGKAEDNNLLEDNVIFSRPYGRWFDKYPIPFIIKRGIYHNWKIIQSLKKKQSEILDQVIPYLFLIKKGTEALTTQNVKTYQQDELTEIIKQFQGLMDEMKSTTASDKAIKTPIRATNFDEELKHLIPDLSAMFSRELFVIAERNILSGLGFIDVVEATSTSRRESILSPKVFIEEVKNGVKDFKLILTQLVMLIQNKNANHRKYMNAEIYITASPIKGLMTDDFKDKLRQLYDRGIISKRTADELIGEVDFRTETYRREKETREGMDAVLYPPVIMNREDTESTDELLHKDPNTQAPSKTPEDETQENIPPDKKGIEKENYNMAEEDDLVTSPYQKITDLPPRVKNSMSKDLQSVFRRVFNNAYEQYKSDTRAFRVAWSVIRKISRQNKKGIWIRKKKRIEGKLEKVQLSQEIIEDSLNKIENEIIDDTMKAKKMEIAEKQSRLLSKLLKDNKDKE